MTDKQFDKKKQELQAAMNAAGFGWIDGKFIQPPHEYNMRSKELSCISMINSILAYDWHGDDAEGVMQMEENAYHNYLAEYVTLFGREKVVELIQGQIDSIRCIKECVHTDNEGVTYNSIVWREN